MQIFKAKDGRMIYPRPHTAVFKGRRNSSKSKALIFLKHCADRYFTAKQIAYHTGVNLEYLQQRLTFWYNIRYINRRVGVTVHGRPCFEYKIAARGLHFVDVRIPITSYNKYVNEINEWVQKKVLTPTS